MTLEERLRLLEDRHKLKALVDTFSNLADTKDVEAQIMLFTEDAVVESYIGGALVSCLTVRKQILLAFSGFLARFDTVYHLNGQQTVEIQGDHATGTAYCLVTLIGDEDGTRKQTTSGVIYKDEYLRSEGEWLIAKRVSNFTWRDEAISAK